MSPTVYALQIGTLAIWLSVAHFGIVGFVIPSPSKIFPPAKPPELSTKLETILLTEDFTPAPPSPSPAAVPFAPLESLPTPPEMPDLTHFTPLPEIPDLPAPTAKPTPTPNPTPAPTPRPASPSKTKPATRSATPTSTTGGSPTGDPKAKGKPSTGTPGLSDAQRLPGGRMPAPAYPAAARSKGQAGTVVVEFTVGTDGSVTSAYAKSPCPWPLLNDCAVSTVRRWKFPSGKTTKYTRPITFKLK